MTAADTLALLDWKRRVFALYAAVRSTPGKSGWELWRDTRDELFRTHPQSPQPGSSGLAYYDYDPGARVLAELEEMTTAEIAEAIGIPLNTAYSRLRVARHEFEEAFARFTAQQKGRRPPETRSAAGVEPAVPQGVMVIAPWRAGAGY